LTALVVLGCHGGPSSPGSPFSGAGLLTPLSDAEEAHDELLRADLGRADSVAKLGSADGLSRRFTTDVIYLREGLPILRGRNAAQTIFAAESLAARAAVRWQPVRAEVSADGRTGYSYGYTIYGSVDKASPSLHLDRYIAFWRRDTLGWKIAAYAETYGAPPPAVALPRAAAHSVVPDVPMPRTYGALEGVRSADAAFAEMAIKIGTGRAFGEYAAETAQIFSAPGELITGPRAISDAFGGTDDKSSLIWHPIAGEVAKSGDLGFTVGNAVFNGQRGDGAPVTRYSKYLTVWKKQRDGSWKYVVDGGSARPAEGTT
jgi:ketosteroid isomerase-like protein